MLMDLFARVLLFALLADAFEDGGKILLDDGGIRCQHNLFFVAAIGALEILLPDVEYEIGAAIFAGEYSTFVIVGRLARGLNCPRGVFLEDRRCGSVGHVSRRKTARRKGTGPFLRSVVVGRLLAKRRGDSCPQQK